MSCLETLDEVTVSFLAIAFGKLCFVYNLRASGTGLFENDVVLGSLVLCSALLVVAVYLPGLSGVLKTEPPGLRG